MRNILKGKHYKTDGWLVLTSIILFLSTGRRYVMRHTEPAVHLQYIRGKEERYNLSLHWIGHKSNNIEVWEAHGVNNNLWTGSTQCSTLSSKYTQKYNSGYLLCLNFNVICLNNSYLMAFKHYILPLFVNFAIFFFHVCVLFIFYLLH